MQEPLFREQVEKNIYIRKIKKTITRCVQKFEHVNF